MKEEIIYSNVDDSAALRDPKKLKISSIWKKCYTKDELPLAMKEETSLFEYTIKFDGLTPVQLTKFLRIK